MAIIRVKSANLMRNDTAQNWDDKNPTLRKGEEGYEIDTKKRKVGDGVTAWLSLPYDNADKVDLSSVQPILNTAAPKATNGHVWTATDSGAGFAKPFRGDLRLIKSITLTESVNAVDILTKSEGTVLAGEFVIVGSLLFTSTASVSVACNRDSGVIYYGYGNTTTPTTAAVETPYSYLWFRHVIPTSTKADECLILTEFPQGSLQVWRTTNANVPMTKLTMQGIGATSAQSSLSLACGGTANWLCDNIRIPVISSGGNMLAANTQFWLYGRTTND